VNPTQTFAITNPLKNSGEDYDLNGYCVSYNGGLTNGTITTWTQMSNGGQTAVIRLATASQLANTSKTIVCSAIKKILDLKRQFYTDEGVSCPDYSTSRLLDTSTNSTTNNTNTTNTSNTSVTGYYSFFYVNPDYTLTIDNLNTVINSSVINNTAAFLNNLTNLLTTNYQITNIESLATIIGQDIAILANTTPAAYPNDTSITVILTLNTDGIMYVGIENTLNSTSLTTNGSNNTIVYNVTSPSLAQLMQGLDCNGNALMQIVTLPVTMNNNMSIIFSNLTVNTTFNVYFAASNLVYPRSYTKVYGIYGTTTDSAATTSQNQKSSFGGIMNQICWILVVLGIVLGMN